MNTAQASASSGGIPVESQLESLPAEALHPMLMQHIAQIEKLNESSTEMEVMLQNEENARLRPSDQEGSNNEEDSRLDDEDIEILKSACIENTEVIQRKLKLARTMQSILEGKVPVGDPRPAEAAHRIDNIANALTPTYASADDCDEEGIAL